MMNPKNLLPGEEQYEVFFSGIGKGKKEMVQYDYRAADGELFSCIRLSLETCRVARDKWLLASGRV